MKNSVYISLLIGLITLISLSFTSSEKSIENDLIVHEWGTFTTLIGSDGKQLSGLYIEEEKLPNFVYRHAFPVSLKDRLKEKKGNFIKPLNVTVKMETPVLYFYSSKSMNASVKVDFPMGSVCQWYPQRSGGDQIASNDIQNVDFGKAYNGWIKWNNFKILAPDSPKKTTTDKAIETKTWNTPRETDANLVDVNGEIEKFLFYRGLGHFSIPLDIKFQSKKELYLKNTGEDQIPFVFVYEKKDDGQQVVWWSGKLMSQTEKQIKFQSKNGTDIEKEFKTFRRVLVKQGLYEKEAIAMLKTWEASYFERPGFRVFWIVPDQIVEEILPLNIEPQPKEIKRVFVGRCDLLTPDFEEMIVKNYNENRLRDYKKDRYYLSMLERVENMNK